MKSVPVQLLQRLTSVLRDHELNEGEPFALKGVSVRRTHTEGEKVSKRTGSSSSQNTYSWQMACNIKHVHKLR